MHQRVSLVSAVLVMALASTGYAAPSTTSDSCADSAEHGQAERQLGHLLLARGEFRLCAVAKCPRVVQKDCTRWVDDMDAAIPTVLFGATNENGDDITSLKVSVDGHAVSSLTSALEIDPGSHVARFEDGVHSPRDRTFVIREGEKRKTVDMRFADPKPIPRPIEPKTEGSSTLTWVSGGLGIAALGGFAVLGLTGLSQYHSLQDDCHHTRACTSSDTSGPKTQLWIADGLGVVGAAAVLFAGYLLLR
jgi:hypothetical protein